MPVNTMAMSCALAAAIAFLVAHGAAGLDDSRDARGSGGFDRVGKGDEGVGGHHRAFGALAGPLDGNAHTVDAVGLAAADADCRRILPKSAPARWHWT